MLHKGSLLFLLSTLFFSVVALEKSKENAVCKTEKQCVQNNNCQCYCSRVCGWRDKEPNDEPIYVADDPAGIHCYCKPWDRDNFYARGCDAQ